MGRRGGPVVARFISAVFLACAAGAAMAGAIAINPVRVTLSAGRIADVLTVRNSGSEPTVVQLELLRWTQDAGVDRLEPTRDLLATPPIFDLPAGGSQIIRVGLRGALPSGPQEVAYRLLLKEVPPAPMANTRGVQIALNISLPVFVLPVAVTTAAPSPALRWQLRRTGEGLWLRADNDGPVHVQVHGLALAGGDRLAPFVPAYLLPGARHEWPVRLDAAPGAALPLVVFTDTGPVPVPVTVTAP
ncbi:fimbria/pilus periplasmic chaperone [Xylophilus sp. Kf1]|nr:fimbria/pilus periplasmic chaperone [Xylophilus sp. Kf1]